MSTATDFTCTDCQAEPGKRCAYKDTPENRIKKRVGRPTAQSHSSRYRALFEYEQQAERLATLEYLRWWLLEFGDIFEHSD